MVGAGTGSAKAKNWVLPALKFEFWIWLPDGVPPIYTYVPVEVVVLLAIEVNGATAVGRPNVN